MIKALLEKIQKDYVAAFSAQAAFFIVISFFPFAMFLLTLIQFLPISEADLLSVCNTVMPEGINAFVSSMITEIHDKASGAIISITIITTVWSASKGVLSVINGLNAVYAIRETRNYILLRILATIYTVIFAAMLLVSLLFLVFGNRIYLWITEQFPILNEFALLVISLRTIVGLCMLTVFFLTLYLFVPNRRSSFMAELPGACFTAGGWMMFSYLYSCYIDRMGQYSYMYGSLTAIVLLMVWLYTCMYMMLLGAEVNQWLEEHLKGKERKERKERK